MGYRSKQLTGLFVCFSFVRNSNALRHYTGLVGRVQAQEPLEVLIPRRRRAQGEELLLSGSKHFCAGPQWKPGHSELLQAVGF